MKFIVLGAAGRMGSLHAKHLIELGHTVLSVDYDDGKGAYIKPDEWAGIEADGVVITTPAEQHAADINTVLAAGHVKHIFVEKPICTVRQLPGMRKMALDAKLNDVSIHVGYNLRCNKFVRGLIAARMDNSVGKIRHAGFMLRQIPKRPIEHFLEEWASHEVDLALYLFGKENMRVLWATWNLSTPEFKCVMWHPASNALTTVMVDGYYEPNVRSIGVTDEHGLSYCRDIEGSVTDQDYLDEINLWTKEIVNLGATGLATAADGIAAISVFTSKGD